MNKLLFISLLFVSFTVHGAEALLAATTSAAQSASITLAGEVGFSALPASATLIIYAASGHTASEYSDIQVSHDGGTTWADVYNDGVQKRLSSTNTAITIYGPGVFRVDKEATTNATGVFVSHKNNL